MELIQVTNISKVCFDLIYLCLPLQESYAILNKHELLVAKEDVERVDTLRYSWAKIASQATEMSHHLLTIQPNFRGNLLENVQTFIVDCDNFYKSYKDVSIPRLCEVGTLMLDKAAY